MLDKKGFLFTVTVFLILIYILLSISVWVKSIEASERSFSEFYKESTVELTMEQITPAKMDSITRVIMNRNLVRLNDYTIEHSLLPGPAGDENQYAREAMGELLVDGNASGSYFRGGDAIPSEGNSSLRAWVDNLNASLRAIGVYVSEYQVTEFALGQSDIDNINYSFDLKFGLKDFTNTSAVSRTYHINNTINVTGLVDPALARESAEATASDNMTIFRQFFFRKDLYPDYSSISVSRMSQTIAGGQGWLYGPLAMAGPSANLAPTATNISPSDRRNYILVGTFEDIEALEPSIYDGFAGYIVTSNPTVTDDGCGGRESNTFNPIKHGAAPDCNVSFDPGAGAMTNKPYIIAPSFNSSKAPECPMLDGTNHTRRCVLLLNTYLESEVAANPVRKLSTSGSGIFELETIRDFVMCGYYTHNPKAPSYLQRLMNDSYTRNSSQFGIETFVVGIYASDYDVYGLPDDVNSRLDRELFYGSVEGVKIRGLPGCRNFNSCSDTPLTGIFAMSDDAATDHPGLDDIACGNGAAGCD